MESKIVTEKIRIQLEMLVREAILETLKRLITELEGRTDSHELKF